jgi:hypothetical protein
MHHLRAYDIYTAELASAGHAYKHRASRAEFGFVSRLALFECAFFITDTKNGPLNIRVSILALHNYYYLYSFLFVIY